MSGGSQLWGVFVSKKHFAILWQTIFCIVYYCESESSPLQIAALAVNQDYPVLSAIVRPLTSSEYYERQAELPGNTAMAKICLNQIFRFVNTDCDRLMCNLRKPWEKFLQIQIRENVRVKALVHWWSRKGKLSNVKAGKPEQPRKQKFPVEA